MRNKYLILFFACLGTALFTLDFALISVSLPKMIGSFSASKIEMAWVITVYSISTAVTIPCLGFLSERFGRKNIYMLRGRFEHFFFHNIITKQYSINIF